MIKCWIDGCCEPVNPGGTAGYGVSVQRDGLQLWEESRIVGSGPKMSNNVAEYSGLLSLLQFLLKSGLNEEQIMVYSDSKLVIEQTWGKPKWKMRQGLYIPIAKQCREYLAVFPNITGTWIPREQNEEADRLSKAALKSRGVKFKLQPEK